MIDYEVVINNKCHGGCSWCSATGKGINYRGLSESWKSVLKKIEKPKSILIGGKGEPTEHPEFPEFLQLLYESGISVSYKTNGVILGTPGDPRAEELLKISKDFCVGVSITLGNKELSRYWGKAISALLETGVKITLLYTISDQPSLDFLKTTIERYPDLNHLVFPKLDLNQKFDVDKEVMKSEILNSENVTFDPERPKAIFLRSKRQLITKNIFEIKY